MYFKQLNSTTAVLAKSSSVVTGRNVFAVLLALLTLFVAGGFERWEYTMVANWSLFALLIWHFLFVRRKVKFDLERQQIITKVTSLYPIAQQVIPFKDIIGLQVLRQLGKSHTYYLAIIIQDMPEPINFDYGSEQQMQKLGQQVSEFCSLHLIKY